MHKRLLYIILITTFLKEIVWIAIIPLWHFPDEQSHVGQIAYLAETGRNVRNDASNNLTDEIFQSEQLLGTSRDELGINKYTYHPEYRIPYSLSYNGIYEHVIDSYAKRPEMRQMVKQESSMYPVFYYAVLATIYRIYSDDSIILRVFLIRILQVIFFLETIFFSYRIGNILFKNQRRSALTLPVLVSFQPMISFVSAGVNSDNIGNFMFSFYTYCLLILSTKKQNWKYVILFIITSFLTTYFKPQFFIVIPVSILVLLYVWKDTIFTPIHIKRNLSIIAAVGALIVYLISSGLLGPLFVIVHVGRILNIFSIGDYVTQYMVSHAYHEVLPWYWGIFDWLGVTYPRVVHRIINWICLIAVIGFILRLIREGFSKKISKTLILLIPITVLSGGVYLYDWFSVTTTGIHLGVQGRYFFPGIISQMLLLLLGLEFILKSKFIKILGILMITLNCYALVLLCTVYYDTQSIEQFIIQASQYKPWFFKGGYLVFWIASYGISLIALLVEYIRYDSAPQATS